MNKILLSLILLLPSFVSAGWLYNAPWYGPSTLPTCAASYESANPTGTTEFVADSGDTITEYQLPPNSNTPKTATVQGHRLAIDGYTNLYGTYTCDWVGADCPADTTYTIATGECDTTLPDTPPITKPVKTLGQPTCDSINPGVGD